MSMTGRKALTYGGLGIVGAGIVTVPISGVSAKSASTLSRRDMPRPYPTALTFPPPAPYQTTVTPRGARPGITP